MKVAYIHNDNFNKNIAGYHIAYCFKKAFEDLGHIFSIFDTNKIDKYIYNDTREIVEFCPDLIMSSTNLLKYIPFKKLKSTKILLWGEFYFPIEKEKQNDVISNFNKEIINKYESLHNFKIWAQHSEEIISKYFKGYLNELNIQVFQLLHAANKYEFIPPIINPINDFIWIGKKNHRLNLYNKYINGISHNYKLLEITEQNPLSPYDIFINKLYSNSLIGINIHTEEQVKQKILLNERAFVSTVHGTLQLTNTRYVNEIFLNNEIDVFDSQNDILEAYNFYKKNPDSRINKIKIAQDFILKNHTYHNRVNQILNIFN